MGTILQEAIAAAPPTCDARTGEAAGHFGFAPLWCNTAIGLRSYVDAQGTVRRFCAVPAHEAAVRGRYPEARAELERGTATFDAPDWDERKARMDAEMMADLELMADEFHGRLR